jgi:hypothetical protein
MEKRKKSGLPMGDDFMGRGKKRKSEMEMEDDE